MIHPTAHAAWWPRTLARSLGRPCGRRRRACRGRHRQLRAQRAALRCAAACAARPVCSPPAPPPPAPREDSRCTLHPFRRLPPRPQRQAAPPGRRRPTPKPMCRRA
eukprot:229224-Chlamydomonas_euryale.AAC.4